MTKEYYEGMFGSLQHNILVLLSQIEANIEYSEGAEISEELKFIEKRCRKIRKQFASQERKNEKENTTMLTM